MPLKLSVPAFLRRPPFARPTRTAWAAAQAQTLGAEAGREVQHAAAEVASAAETARDRLRHAAREAMAKHGGARQLRTKSPKKPGGPAKKGKPSTPRASTMGVIEAAALFTLAGLIVAWPRPGQATLGQRLAAAFRKGRSLGASSDIAGAELAAPRRGRTARHPWQIPLRGWRDILVRTWNEFNRDQIAAVAGGVTFFGLLSMFPALGAFVSLYGLFADVETARQQLRLLAGFLPHDVLKFVGDEMMQLAGGKHGSLGFAFALSLLLSLWSANGAVKALFHGLNVAYEEKERRGLVVLNITSLAFTVGVIVFAILAVATVIVAPVVLGYLGLTAQVSWLAALRWPVMLAVLVLGLSTIYRYGPSRQHARWSWISVGGVVAAVLWVAASLIFSVYVANFAHYDRTYGSLGAVIGFMFWLWYTTIIVLFGAELNAELERQTAVDTTTGAPLPMGARGAKMADTLPPGPKEKAF